VCSIHGPSIDALIKFGRWIITVICRSTWLGARMLLHIWEGEVAESVQRHTLSSSAEDAARLKSATDDSAVYYYLTSAFNDPL
jgi:hypothetical protein